MVHQAHLFPGGAGQPVEEVVALHGAGVPDELAHQPLGIGEGLQIQGALVVEVVKEQPLGHPRLGGDEVGGGAFVLPAGEHLHGRVEDRPLFFLFQRVKGFVHLTASL